MRTRGAVIGLCVFCAVAGAFAERTGPWPKEKAWAWYNAQPWMRGCNYMPASAANRVDQWQELGSEERFKEVDRELALAASIGFNTLRILVEEQGFGVWYHDHDGFMTRFERMLSIMERHGIRAIVVLGNDCSRPKELWKLPAPGPQPCDWGYHGGRKLSQHGSFPGAIGYTSLDDPELNPKVARVAAWESGKMRERAGKCGSETDWSRNGCWEKNGEKLGNINDVGNKKPTCRLLAGGLSGSCNRYASTSSRGWLAVTGGGSA